MTRKTALLVVMMIAGAQVSALTCELVCAASAVSDRGDGCHAEAADATGFRVVPVPAPCHHGAVGLWLTDVVQPGPKSVVAAAVLTADTVGTNPPPTDSTNPRRWPLPKSPPPLGSVGPSILRI